VNDSIPSHPSDSSFRPRAVNRSRAPS
jgi:hypothetical protein